MAGTLLKLILRALTGRRLPHTEGVLEVPGLTGRVRVDRDRYGIPHIDAGSDADAWFTLGFCQGQDRSFQIEMVTRVVRGTMSEMIGRDMVPLDRLARRIGFKRAAAASWDLLGRHDRLGLDAYAAGVNSGRELGSRAKPHELALLRVEPTRFEATDVLALGALQALALSGNWDSELARLEILKADGEQALRDVDPRYPEWHPVTQTPDAAGSPVEALRESLELLAGTSGWSGASNNWALSAAKTSTGRPLLANDPHLAPVLPPHWYLAHVTTPEWSIAGACFVGSPLFASGHNGRVAWGVTAGLVDNTDLFIEEIGPDGASVRRGESFVPCHVLEEHIAVRGSSPVTEEVLVTPHGPVVGPALHGAHEAVAMAATWLRPQRATAGLDLVRAESCADLTRRLEDWSGPSLNFVSADVSGSIHWKLVGEAPIRKRGRGAIPLPAWLDDVGWEDEYLPYEAMPGVSDPDRGYVASANTRPTTGDHPFLGVDWIAGYRLSRIHEMLEQRDDWDVPATLAAQLDTVTPAWAEMKPHIIGLAHTAETTTALSLLESWDGDVSADSAAASVYVLWLTDMQRRVAEQAAPNSTETVLGRGFAPPALFPYSMFAFGRTGHLARLLKERPDGWFDDWSQPIRASLAHAERALRDRMGPDARTWAWGRARPLRLLHPAGQTRPLDRVFNIGPISWSGDFTTVSQAGAPPLEPLGNPSAIPSLRMAVDVGNWDASRFSLSGGQSGNPLSPHYADQLTPWREGRGVAIPWSADAVAVATVETLHLIPREPA